MRFTLIGIDCATDPKKMGFAKGVFSQGILSIEDVSCGEQDVASQLRRWISIDEPTLIAIDAPLGWPKALGDNLLCHMAGGEIDIDPNLLFRRETDRFIKKKTGKQPLDVGADRIARTAVSAIKILNKLRTLTGHPIPLAWTPMFGELGAIEVYPGATMQNRQLPNTGYKGNKTTERAMRQEIVNKLPGWVKISKPEHLALLLDDADILDAVICCIAGVDFLRGNSMPPEDFALAKKEGWIWVIDKERE